MRLVTRLKIELQRLDARLRQTPYPPISHGFAGSFVEALYRPKSGPHAPTGHSLDAEDSHRRVGKCPEPSSAHSLGDLPNKQDGHGLIRSEASSVLGLGGASDLNPLYCVRDQHGLRYRCQPLAESEALRDQLNAIWPGPEAAFFSVEPCASVQDAAQEAAQVQGANRPAREFYQHGPAWRAEELRRQLDHALNQKERP